MIYEGKLYIWMNSELMFYLGLFIMFVIVIFNLLGEVLLECYGVKC